jgi:hypothetical protein
MTAFYNKRGQERLIAEFCRQKNTTQAIKTRQKLILEEKTKQTMTKNNRNRLKITQCHMVQHQG